MTLARRALERRGHTVTAVFGLRPAMTALSKQECDVVALDYQLPDITGLQVLENIRLRDPALPVVMVTASGSEQVAVDALKKGASDYVVKAPGYERELARALELSVQRARAEAAEAALRAELERRARTDSLTGLLNREEMERLLKQEIQRAGGRHRVFTFVLADVDLFKSINDTHGHAAGDAVLCHVARVLRKSVRSSDFVARWGGDEFALFLPGTGRSGANAFAKRLSRLVSELAPACCAEIVSPVTLSVGVVCVPEAASDLAVVLKWADTALYAAKAAGRNNAKVLVVREAEEAGAEQNPSPRPDQARMERSGGED